jgi:predicted nucleic acid-binding protein
MRAVIDASYLIEFLGTPFEDRFAWIPDAELTAPSILVYEFHNVLLKGLKTEHSDLLRFHEVLNNLRIKYFDIAGSEAEIYRTAAEYNLSFYDASYLWLAADNKIPVATGDKQILQAAEALKVKVII